MKKQIFIICFVINFIFPSFSFASPQINEFSSSSTDDWIEIYNPDSASVDLSAYRIRDSSENNKLDLSGSLAPMSFIVFDWANKLNNGGDIIKLVLISDDSSVDQVTYGNQGGLIAPDINQSAGRISDGNGNWTIFSTQSKNASNNSSSVFTPPTPTPSKTPTPTKTPPTPKTVTSSPAKITSPTRSVSSVSFVSNIPTRSSSKQNNSDKIAQAFKANNYTSIRNLTEAPQIFNKSEVLGVTDRKIPALSLFGGILLILAGVIASSLKYISIREIYDKLFNE